jgi:hypothetical protein
MLEQRDEDHGAIAPDRITISWFAAGFAIDRYDHA